MCTEFHLVKFCHEIWLGCCDPSAAKVTSDHHKILWMDHCQESNFKLLSKHLNYQPYKKWTHKCNFALKRRVHFRMKQRTNITVVTIVIELWDFIQMMSDYFHLLIILVKI